MNPRRETPSISDAPPGNSLAAPGTAPSRERSSIERQSGREGRPVSAAAAPPFCAPTIGSDRRARSFARASWLSSQLMNDASSVARGAAGARVDVVLHGEQPSRFDRIALGLPLHVGNLGDRSEVLFRVPVAIEAEAHGESRGLLDGGHLIDPAVAADAADALVHVDRVVEVHELGNLVDPPPFEGLVLEEALAHRFEERALVPDLRVAVQTERRLRDAGGR